MPRSSRDYFLTWAFDSPRFDSWKFDQDDPIQLLQSAQEADESMEGNDQGKASGTAQNRDHGDDENNGTDHARYKPEHSGEDPASAPTDDKQTSARPLRGAGITRVVLRQGSTSLEETNALLGLAAE